MVANMIALGAAYQRGALPVDAMNIEEAIAHNGVVVTMNQNAFRLGRAAVAQPEWLAAEQSARATAPAEASVLSSQEEAILTHTGTPAGSEMERLLRWRIPELVAYQNAAYARDYADVVRAVYAEESQRMPGETRFQRSRRPLSL